VNSDLAFSSRPLPTSTGLPLSPMRILAVGVEHALDVAVLRDAVANQGGRDGLVGFLQWLAPECAFRLL
jgi:hypothetical protein